MTPTAAKLLIIAIAMCGACTMRTAPARAQNVCLQVKHFKEHSPKCLPMEGLREAIMMAFSTFSNADVAEVTVRTPKRKLFGFFPLPFPFVGRKPLMIFKTHTVAAAPIVTPYRDPSHPKGDSP